MAAGLPVVAPSVGDVGQMVAEANWPYIAPHVAAVELRDMITMLARAKAERKPAGAPNQAKAQATFDDDAMMADYDVVRTDERRVASEVHSTLKHEEHRNTQ